MSRRKGNNDKCSATVRVMFKCTNRSHRHIFHTYRLASLNREINVNVNNLSERRYARDRFRNGTRILAREMLYAQRKWDTRAKRMEIVRDRTCRKSGGKDGRVIKFYYLLVNKRVSTAQFYGN
ncbi:hypothetical protein PUN28_001555 [Cardiocondyla obscurior]|uniref:50S ribosomal protein L20 n=1 Tax=Cardiocondyla obscurior TaxID=286306 RepID=A0AAW2H5K4_9HYME